MHTSSVLTPKVLERVWPRSLWPMLYFLNAVMYTSSENSWKWSLRAASRSNTELSPPSMVNPKKDMADFVSGWPKFDEKKKARFVAVSRSLTEFHQYENGFSAKCVRLNKV